MSNKVLKRRLEKNKKNRFQKEQTEVFLSLLDREYQSVLEVGCGRGFFTFIGALNNKFKKCYGCDIYQEYQINEINPYVERIEYHEILNSKLPFEDETFDLAFSMDVLEHIEKDIKMIGEKIRVVKKGGDIIIGTPNYLRITNLILRAVGRLKYPRNIGKDSYGDIIHIREYTKSKLLEIVKKYADQIEDDSIEIHPCWYGISPFNISFGKLPKILENICQFWFVKFKKK